MTMQTLDCWRSNRTGELTVICTGMATAPIAIDLETGTSVVMCPAWAHTELARFGIASVSSAVHGCTGNAWWADLPIDKDRTEARLALVTDNVVRNFTARWPEPEPEPVTKPEPKRARRQGKGQP
mgnify:CR=1 FL=1